MHEASLARELVSIIDRAARARGATRVVRARLALGRLAGVEAHALGFAFEVLRAAGAYTAECELVIEPVPVAVACPACGARGPCEQPVLGCPRCGGAPVDVIAGREMLLSSIDVIDVDLSEEPARVPDP
ncbi:hydrogenase maturation nickel metallochaperone HypA [Haliangium sp.]|uniref:hydrogenase maturation nickel metallochaperone HypA/HybF n=1 Tax=Haliangium sp. TaxID=2663208 RepID=UPI003D153226